MGIIGESDLKQASISKDSVIIGLGTTLDKNARDLNETLKIEIKMFDIIYELTDYLKKLLEENKPKEKIEETLGKLKVLKKFNNIKTKQVLGGKVTDGEIKEDMQIKIIRQDEEIGRGKISGIQRNKIEVKNIEAGAECGILIESKTEIETGDTLEAFIITIK